MSKDITHYPNGGLCLTCTKLLKDCSKLPFKDMRVIGKDKKTKMLMVLCSERVEVRGEEKDQSSSV